MTDSTALGDRPQCGARRMLKGSALADAKRQAIARFEAGGRVPAVASATGVGLSTLYAWHRVWREDGGDRLMRKPDAHVLSPLSLQEGEVLDGLMLGDGCLSMGRLSRNPCLSITRTATDVEYLNWTAGVFAGRLTESPIRVRDVFDHRTQKTYRSARLRTRCDPAFLAQRNRWYPDGKKIVPRDLELSATAVAVWLADDGHVSAASRRCPEIRFATHGFREQEVRKLASLLLERYGGRFSLHQENPRGQFTVRVSGAAARGLLRDVDPVFPPLARKSDRWRKTDLLSERVPAPNCPRCTSVHVIYWSRSSKGVQTFKCKTCVRVFRERYERAGRIPHPRQEGTT